MELIRFLVDLLYGQGSFYELLEKHPVRKTLELLELLLVELYVVLLFVLFGDLLPYAFKGIDHVGLGDGL